MKLNTKKAVSAKYAILFHLVIEAFFGLDSPYKPGGTTQRWVGVQLT